MLSIGVGMLIVGAVLGFGAVLFAILNMGSVAVGDRRIRDVAVGHLASMAVMVVGGFIAFAGIVTTAIALYSTHVG